jgi:hypothetical protein
MDNQDRVLALRVQGINQANEYAKTLYTQLQEIFEPLVGQKIWKADGTLLAKFAKLLPKFPFGPQLHVYSHSSIYSLAWVVKTCLVLQPEGHAYYHSTIVYIGDMKGDTLVRLATSFEHRTDYTVEEVKHNRTDYIEKKKAADEAYSKLHLFGEYDRR